MNLVIIQGNVGTDIEVRSTQSGQQVADISVAANERWTDAKGHRQERTVWANVTVWGQMAINCGQYLKKGSSVLVKGSLRDADAFIGSDGKPTSRNRINAQEVTFLDKAPTQPTN